MGGVNNLLVVFLQHFVFDLHGRKCAKPFQGAVHFVVRQRQWLALLERQKLLNRIPVLFNQVDIASFPYLGPRAPGEKLVVGAVWPGVINGVVLTGYQTYLAPNPWGPVVNGIDIAKKATEAGPLATAAPLEVVGAGAPEPEPVGTGGRVEVTTAEVGEIEKLAWPFSTVMYEPANRGPKPLSWT